MLKFIGFFFSPFLLLMVALVSYFSLLTLGFVADDNVASDLWIVGVFSVFLLPFIYPFRMLRVNLDEKYANRLIVVICLIFSAIFSYLLVYFEGHITQLLDARFSVPGFGPISSAYAIGTVVGCSVYSRANGISMKFAYVFLVLILGYLIGGKGFLLYAATGFGLAIRSQIVTSIGFLKISLFGAALILSLVFSFSQAAADGELFLEKFIFRIYYAADSIIWIGQMSLSEIHDFSISIGSFLGDLILRFLGLRINKLSVGAEIANVVASLDTGAGPNPTLPVLAYLISHGNVVYALVFILAALGSLHFFLRFCLCRVRNMSGSSVIFAAAVFLSPSFYIDPMVYFQYIFWLLFITLVVSADRLFKSLYRRIF